MDPKKVIVTLLILTIILSIATIAFQVFVGGKTTAVKSTSTDRATVGLYVQEHPVIDDSNVGLYVNK